MFKLQRIRDPLHNLIEFHANEFENVLWGVIQTRPFQRLRRVKQLGFSDFVYPGATHSGGSYSIYTASCSRVHARVGARSAIAQEAVAADPVELELAATAAFLFAEGSGDPWNETAKRKPEKVGGDHLEKAKELYRRLRALKTPRRLPAI